MEHVKNNMPARKIIHIDMDCFYAAVEMRDDPTLRNCPIAVGGDPSGRGVVCAANYEARKYGIHSAMSSSRAKRLYPNLIILPPNMKKYRNESKVIQEIFHRFSYLVEPLSLDEAYIDVTSSDLFRGSATLIASEIRKLIYSETGLTASAGVAPNKFLAKVASEWNKPNGQFVITPGMVQDFVVKLPVKKICGVGKVTAEKMSKLGLTTCGDLQKLSIQDLSKYFGSFGKQLYKICKGIDDRLVVTSRESKSLSVENTFPDDLKTYDECAAQLAQLFQQFINRLERKNKKEPEIKTLFVKVKFSDFKSTTVERGYNELNETNFRFLLKEGFSRRNRPIRLLGIGVRFKPRADKGFPQQLEFVF